MKRTLSFVGLVLLVVGFLGNMQYEQAQAGQENLFPQPTWHLIRTDPDWDRGGMQMVYDSERKVTVMFGGRNWNHPSLAETLEYDGNTWTMVNPTHQPPARFWHGMAYDQARGVVVVFGGNDGVGSALNDTWEYDGTDWAQVQTEHAPVPRMGFGMTYDSCREKVVVFGGGEYPTGTWEYDGADWMESPVVNSPASVYLTGMTFDSARCRTVLFGGDGGSATGLDTTWEYDGTDWMLITTATSPMPRWGHALAYNPMIGKVVLYGGYGPQYPTGTALGDTWEYDGTDWVETSPVDSPGAREQHAMTYNGKGRILMVGYGETWLYGPEIKIYLPIVTRNAYTCNDHPVLIWPETGTTVNTLIPEYYWDTCDLPEAIEVDLQISPNPDMSDWVLWLATFPTGKGTFTDYKNLLPDTTYYWRIRARYDNDVYGPYSEGIFHTALSGVLMPPPNLIAPLDGNVLSGTSATFQWEAVAGVEEFMLVISSEDGSEVTYVPVYGGTEFTVSHLTPVQNFFWYVASVSDYGIGEPSVKWYFTSGGENGA
ncbi:MAG: hypothetical protein H6636_00150 [Anaerolineales bacterium]|nr:hypothetical protein [Anaerolineales bacterium]